MTSVLVNGQWEIEMPDFRAERPDWTSPEGWERARLDAMHEAISPGDVLFDIGTEEGEMSGLFSLWGAEMVLFEPNENVWPCIRAVWEANGLQYPLRMFVGFASDVTSAHLPSLEVQPWPTCTKREMIRAHDHKLLSQDEGPQIRLDDFSAETEIVPDILTIDVEGAEGKVLRGAEALLKDVHPLVFCSLHPEELRDQYGEEAFDVIEWMQSLGYDYQHLATDHEMHALFRWVG